MNKEQRRGPPKNQRMHDFTKIFTTTYVYTRVSRSSLGVFNETGTNVSRGWRQWDSCFQDDQDDRRRYEPRLWTSYFRWPTQPIDHAILFYPHTFSMPSPFSCSHYLTHIHILISNFCEHFISTMYILFILNYILHTLSSTSRITTWNSPSHMTIQLYVAIFIIVVA